MCAWAREGKRVVCTVAVAQAKEQRDMSFVYALLLAEMCIMPLQATMCSLSSYSLQQSKLLES